jgi:hypothetical protein
MASISRSLGSANNSRRYRYVSVITRTLIALLATADNRQTRRTGSKGVRSGVLGVDLTRSDSASRERLTLKS